jgi:hypothetical protein
MSQLDLIAQLRESRPLAPAELREHVRQIAAQAPVPRKRFTWRRAVVVLVPVAAAAALAVAFFPRANESGQPEVMRTTAPAAAEEPFATDAASAPSAKAQSGSALAPTAPPTSRTRAQRYSATLTLRLPTAKAVSAATTRALKTTAALGGYPVTVRVDAAGKDGNAYLVLKVPRSRVQDAVRRLGALGTIVAENVQIQDLQAGVDTTGRRISRLQTKVNALRAQPQTDEVTKQIASLTKQLERLRLGRAATLRAAQFATVELQLATPPKAAPEEHGDGPLHGLGVAFQWIGIGAVYALALGTPLVLLVALGWLLGRGVRRRRDERLLSRS